MTIRTDELEVLVDRKDVVKLPAPSAHEVVVLELSVRVVAFRAAGARDLEYLAHRDELIQGVVNRREADLGQSVLRAAMDRLGREVEVLAVEHLGHGAALGSYSPLPLSESFQEITDLDILGVGSAGLGMGSAGVARRQRASLDDSGCGSTTAGVVAVGSGGRRRRGWGLRRPAPSPSVR